MAELISPLIKPRRALGLDALRGFAILTMVLSGAIPTGLPRWMYHAQTPNFQFNPNLPGLTWVDLVFPFFLFALGTAIPLALSRRLERGESYPKLLWHIVERTLLLGFFAIFLRHVRPNIINPEIWTNPHLSDHLLGILGFAVMFAIFMRTPKGWNKTRALGLKIAGWIGVLLFILLLHYPDGSGFSLYRNNIILVVLTNGFFFGSLIWLITRNNTLLRLAFLGLYLGLRLSHSAGGWIAWLWNASAIPWIYKLDYLKYLFIIIPGTIVGDCFLTWMNTPDENEGHWSSARMSGIVAGMFAFILLMLVGLQARLLWQTTLITSLLLLVCLYLFSGPGNADEQLLRTLFGWGAVWLILGLIFEPFEGGIKKDPGTMSFYFLTTGLSICLLTAFTMIIDIFKKQNWLQLLIENGQNPMIAYVALGNLVRPVFGITHLDRVLDALAPTPWLGFLKGLVYTALLALTVRFFTRRKLFWRT